MAKKKKPSVELFDEPEYEAKTVPEEKPAVYDAVVADAAKKWIVNCHRCGASLH